MKTVTAFVKHPYHPSASEPPPIPLVTSEETLSFLIDKAKAFDADLEDDGDEIKAVPDLDTDLPDYSPEEDSPYDELISALHLLNEDQLVEILALIWVGRGDYDRSGWREALQTAKDANEDRDIADYLAGTPLLGDYLLEGLSELGHKYEDTARLSV